MQSLDRRIGELERALNVNAPVYVIESHPSGRTEFYNVNTGETTPTQPAGAFILARVGDIDISRL